MKGTNDMADFRNEFIVAGYVFRKTYNESDGRLYLTIHARVPEMYHRKDEATEIVQNFPQVVMEGELAREWDEKIKISNDLKDRQYLIVLGHTMTERYMRHVSGANYRREFRNLYIAKEVIPTRAPANMNYVFFNGEITHEWHSEDPAKKFYIISLKVGDGITISVTYFNRNMDFEPRVGERISMLGRIQTERKENEPGKGHPRYTYYNSIVAKAITKL